MPITEGGGGWEDHHASSQRAKKGSLTLMLSADDDMSHTQTSTTDSDVRGHRINYRRLVPYLPCRGGPPANSALDAALWVQPEIDELGPETTWCLLLAGRIILKAPASARRPTPTTHLIFSLPALNINSSAFLVVWLLWQDVSQQRSRLRCAPKNWQEKAADQTRNFWWFGRYFSTRSDEKRRDFPARHLVTVVVVPKDPALGCTDA